MTADRITPDQRSRNMSKIRGRDTKPELKVRSVLHRMGYRFRLHRKDLPGKPDIVLPKHSTAIFVHGCFWHRHSCPNGRAMPSTNRDFWERKFAENVVRDRRNRRELTRLGWRVLVIWECQTKSVSALEQRLRRRLVECS